MTFIIGRRKFFKGWPRPIECPKLRSLFAKEPLIGSEDRWDRGAPLFNYPPLSQQSSFLIDTQHSYGNCNKFFLDDFYDDKKISLFLRLHPLGFPHPKQRQTTRKYTSFTTQFGSTHTRRSADFKKNLFFWRFRRFRGGSSMTRLQRTKKASQPPKHPQTAQKTDIRHGTSGGAWQLQS